MQPVLVFQYLRKYILVYHVVYKRGPLTVNPTLTAIAGLLALGWTSEEEGLTDWELVLIASAAAMLTLLLCCHFFSRTATASSQTTKMKVDSPPEWLPNRIFVGDTHKHVNTADLLHQTPKIQIWDPLENLDKGWVGLFGELQADGARGEELRIDVVDGLRRLKHLVKQGSLQHHVSVPLSIIEVDIPGPDSEYGRTQTSDIKLMDGEEALVAEERFAKFTQDIDAISVFSLSDLEDDDLSEQGGSQHESGAASGAFSKTMNGMLATSSSFSCDAWWWHI